MNARPTAAHLTLAVALVAAPVLMGAASLVDLSPRADDTAELLALVAESPGRWEIGRLLFLLSGIAWVAAAVGLLVVFRGRSRAGLVGAVGLLLGGAAFVPIEAAGSYLAPLATGEIARSDQVTLVTAVEASGQILAFETVHVVGLLGGMVLVAVGQLRTGVVPRWAPALLVLGLVGILAFTSGVPLAIAMGAVAASMSACAVRLVRRGGQRTPSVGRTGAAPRIEQSTA